MKYSILVLVAYAAVMLLSTVFFTKRVSNMESFCVGDRKANWILSALSIAATWIWAPSLFTSTENAYINGFAGLFWFWVPNVLCLILFIPFASRIREEMPQGITLSSYMYEKYHSKAVRNIYLFQLGTLSVLSTGVQLLAGGRILNRMTGIPFVVTTIIMAFIAFSYAQFSGINASMLTDAIQMVFMLGVSVCFALFSIKNGGGMKTLITGLGGIKGNADTLFSQRGLEIFFTFGLPTTIGLLSGPFGDQCFWQRVYCIKKGMIGKAFLIGALLFGVVPLSMGILGFIGAGMGYMAIDMGVVNFELISTLFPSWVAIPFLFMVVSGLLSTIDSNLCAVSSLTTDILKTKEMRKTKVVMILLLVIGIMVANIPNITVTHLFLTYGTLRASTLLPTIFTLKGIELKPKGIVLGVICALVIGFPIFAYGNIKSIATYKTIGSLATVLLSGVVALAVSRKYVQKNG